MIINLAKIRLRKSCFFVGNIVSAFMNIEFKIDEGFIIFFVNDFVADSEL